MPDDVNPTDAHDDQLRDIARALIAEAPEAPAFPAAVPGAAHSTAAEGPADITVTSASAVVGRNDRSHRERRWASPRPSIAALSLAAAALLVGGFIWFQPGGSTEGADTSAIVSSPLDAELPDEQADPVDPAPDAPTTGDPSDSDSGNATSVDASEPFVAPTPFPEPSEEQRAAIDDLTPVPLGSALAAIARDDAGVPAGRDGQPDQREIFVYAEPWGSAQRLPVLPFGASSRPEDVGALRLLHPDDAGQPLVLSVMRGGADDEWLQVQSPVGVPLQSVWVHRADFDLVTHDMAMIVRLGGNPVIQVVRGGDLLFEESIFVNRLPNESFPAAGQSWVHSVLERPDDIVDTIEFGTIISTVPEGLKRLQIRSFASLTSSSRPPGGDVTMRDGPMTMLASLVQPGTPVWIYSTPDSLAQVVAESAEPADTVDLSFGQPATPRMFAGYEPLQLRDPEPPVIGSLFLIAQPDAGLPANQTPGLPTRPTTTDGSASDVAPRSMPGTRPIADDTRVIPVYDEPDGEARMLVYRNDIDGVSQPFPLINPSVFDQPLVLRIVQGLPGDEWFLVQAPTRPTRRTIWVRAQDFDFETTTASIEIDARVGGGLTLFNRGEPTLTSLVVSARDSRPHTFHDTYIDQVFDASTLSPAYGNWIATHNTWSEALGTFGGGGLPGQSLHGTNQPALVDQAVSSGGVRVSNETMQEIVDAPGGLLGASIVIYHGGRSQDARDWLTEAPWDPAETMQFDPEQIPASPVPSYS